MEGCCLLACSHGLLSLLSYRTQVGLPRSGASHSGLVSPTSISHQGQADGGDSSVSIPSSQVTLVRVKLMKVTSMPSVVCDTLLQPDGDAQGQLDPVHSHKTTVEQSGR